ncbi:hypothetical protein [Spongiimicrobium sp. 3-5]|uniref:hypothetical protein n=1 Tax=Spongiimicrobium sp. 3-5 TaxID=3332596 RepID=UPI0039805C74
MKKTILVTTALFLTLSLEAQWTDNGANLTTSDNVGIGTTNPIAHLEVNKNINATTSAYLLNQSSSANARAMLLVGKQATGGFYGYLVHHNAGHVASFGNYASARSTWLLGADLNGLNIIAGNSQGKIVFGTSTSEKMRLTANGYLGIGTANPDMKLTVNGNIHAKEVKIDLSVPAPDYVFKEDYNLRSIEVVEEFIKENGHLPEIPSAKEFEQHGVMLAEMDMNLLKKIEELTLYTIQQEKKIEKQTQQMEELKSLVQKLIESKK